MSLSSLSASFCWCSCHFFPLSVSASIPYLLVVILFLLPSAFFYIIIHPFFPLFISLSFFYFEFAFCFLFLFLLDFFLFVFIIQFLVLVLLFAIAFIIYLMFYLSIFFSSLIYLFNFWLHHVTCRILIAQLGLGLSFQVWDTGPPEISQP